MTDQLQAVRERYAETARSIAAGVEQAASCDDSCCGTGTASFGSRLYSAEERRGVPDEAALASLGCGNPTAVADLRPGETVLDLGSGAGLDVLLSAQRVGPTGKAYGLDMTEEMLALARQNAQRAGATNVEFLKGRIEDVPLPAGTIDVVISNCVINLSVDKPAVFAEMARVLRPGGRLGVSDVVAADGLTAAERAERGSFVGCIAGALSVSEYETGLRAAGFEDVSVTFTHEVADRMYGAIVRGTRSAAHSERVAANAVQAVEGVPAASVLAIFAASPGSGSSTEATSASACCGGECCS
jgi:arsenite methyltransferase